MTEGHSTTRHRNEVHRMITFVGSGALAASAAEQAAEAANAWLGRYEAAQVDLGHVDTQTIYVQPPPDVQNAAAFPSFQHVITISYVEHLPAAPGQHRQAWREAPQRRTAASSWLKRLQQRLRARAGDQPALPEVRHPEGFVMRALRLPTTSNAAPQRALVSAATTWLSQRIARIATPDGDFRCRVMLTLITRAGGERRLLWCARLPAFSLDEQQQGLAAAYAQLTCLPLAAYPRASHLEVYLLEAGARLEQALAAMDCC